MVPLDDLGRAQAQRLADELASLEGRPTQLWSSDLLRAEQTAGEVAALVGLPVRVDARLRELEFGDHEGRLLSELLEQDAAFQRAWTQDLSLLHPPGGESFAQVTRRVLEWFAEARPREAGEVVLAVSHGVTLTALLCALTNLTPPEARAQGRFHHANAAYTALSLDPRSGQVLACSEVQGGHLAGLG